MTKQQSLFSILPTRLTNNTQTNDKCQKYENRLHEYFRFLGTDIAYFGTKVPNVLRNIMPVSSGCRKESSKSWYLSTKLHDVKSHKTVSFTDTIVRVSNVKITVTKRSAKWRKKSLWRMGKRLLEYQMCNLTSICYVLFVICFDTTRRFFCCGITMCKMVISYQAFSHKLQKAHMIFVLSVCPSLSMYKQGSTGRIYVKFDTRGFHENLLKSSNFVYNRTKIS